jgi:hypothetical protein
MKTTKRQVLIRKEDQRKRWLRWVLKLLRADFKSLPRGERETLLDELLFFTSSGFPLRLPFYKDFDYYENHFFPPPESRSPEEQERFDLAESNMGQIQEALRSMIQDILSIISTESQDSPKDYDLCESMAVLSMSSVFTWDKDRFQLRFRPKDDNDLVAWAKVHFAELLQGLPAHAISKCKGCGTYFLNLTQRDKFYCNSACASRSIQQEKRVKLKEDPGKYDAYLEKQSGYYWKKQEARLGKVRRPPRKKRGRRS